MKGIIVFVLSTCVLAQPVLAATTDIGEGGQLNFSISIRQGTCELEEDSIEVDMGTTMLALPVRVGREFNQKPFSIGLKNCSNVLRTYITMKGTPDAVDPNLFALDSGGDNASGIGLKIVRSTGEQVLPFATDSTPIEYNIPVDGDYQFDYVASFIPVTTKAKAGRVNALIDFSVQYE
ncbi:TPA: long polar fimbrial protein LpfE [Enterobacter asburiae]|nr:long polar fimbrial protein LpfE [Enterobacter asburiae]